MQTESLLEHGIKVIRQYLQDIPSAPGIYRYLDKDDNVLYVGKARNLPKRVVSYTNPARLSYRIQAMISKIAKMDVIVTKTEAEALLLEANLIKKHSPKYNILLKDDKSYPYILIETTHDFPRITKHRGARTKKGFYFGPYPSAGSVNKVISDLQKAFLVRPCTDSFFAARKRPCIEYQIKRCSGPCVSKISNEEYNELIAQLKNYLEGKTRIVQQQLVSKMQKASEAMNYEKAAQIRDRIKALNQIQAKQHVEVANIQDADVIGVYLDQETSKAAIVVQFFRGGQLLGSRPFFPKHTMESSECDVLAAFIGQFYQNNIPPKQIIISASCDDKSALEVALGSLAGYKVVIINPLKGDKRNVVLSAIANAKAAYIQNISTEVAQKNLLQSVQKLFAIEWPLKRIEIYDNSHIMGKYQLGAMVVAGEDGFLKDSYRKYNIKDPNIKPGDDYAMMREVLSRRFKKLLDDAPNKIEGIWPDLILIDGGKGQLSVAVGVLQEFKLLDKVAVVAISKGPNRNAGEEEFHTPDRASFRIDKNDPTLYFLQNLRDEAHRYVIGSHRNKRGKDIEKSSLDEISGIGAKRKKALLYHFGSVAAIKSATIEEICKVEGISRKMAEYIKNCC